LSESPRVEAVTASPPQIDLRRNYAFATLNIVHDQKEQIALQGSNLHSR
jgi:hypothetical protein